MKLQEMKPKTETKQIDHPRIVSEAEWLVARKDLLTREKEFTRLRDALSQHRRELPWIKINKEYVFDGPKGKETLADLFDGCSQLIVYHFMFGPDWEEGCKSCSYVADHFNGANWHLPQRDVTLVAISRAPLSKLEAYKKRMGWRFKWLSSHGKRFQFRLPRLLHERGRREEQSLLQLSHRRIHQRRASRSECLLQKRRR